MTDICTLFIGFFLMLIIMPILIPILRRLKAGNTERLELASHQVKNGTPSMGGIAIVLVFAGISIFLAINNTKLIPVMILTIGFGIIGFLDDFIKVVLRRSDGLIAWQKFLLQIVVMVAFAVYMNFSDISLAVRIPVTGALVDLGWITFPLMFLAVLGTVNGSNFTDGLDGLETTVTLVIAGFLGMAAYKLDESLVPVIAGMIGILLGFLMFNVHPAKVFMGDTGSLALGGFVIGIAYVMQLPLFVVIVAAIYLAEVLSVIIQVGYFKLTHGKRVFRMAPIHHHFELGGWAKPEKVEEKKWSEVKVVAVFSTVTALLCVAAYFML